jgi:ribose 5-phosphate isomerase B
MRVALGSDHAGFALKEAVKGFLTAEHREVLDLGTPSTDPVDYSDYAEAVGRALRENRAERGILLCGSSVGASMAANTFRVAILAALGRDRAPSGPRGSMERRPEHQTSSRPAASQDQEKHEK